MEDHPELVTGADEAPSPLALLIATTMRARGLTLSAVAQVGGLSIASVAALRGGGRGKRPRPETLEGLATGLGLPLEQVQAAVHGDDAARLRRLAEVCAQLPAEAQETLLNQALELLAEGTSSSS